MVILGALVAQVAGDPPEQVQTEVAGREGVQHPALLRGLVAEADDAGGVLLLEITHEVLQGPGLTLLALWQRNCGCERKQLLKY